MALIEDVDGENVSHGLLKLCVGGGGVGTKMQDGMVMKPKVIPE